MQQRPSAEELVPRRRRRPKRLCAPRPPALTIGQILEWADAHHVRTGQWPNATTGWVHENPNEKWCNVDQALRMGLRTLPPGRSLARLLIEMRGARFRNCPPPLTEAQILDWADAHKQRTGAWPSSSSGAVGGVAGEYWPNIERSLSTGRRGLPGNSSIAQLLSAHRGTRNKKRLPPLTINEILDWADAYQRATGKWPTYQSGPIAVASGETWSRVDQALRDGLRSFPGGSSLARLLAEHRGRRNHMDRPLLTEEQILEWADAHFRRTGRWPSAHSGTIAEAADDNWHTVNHALSAGVRGLRGGTSLARLLAEHRNRRNNAQLPSLSVKEILRWADAHFQRTGRWPTAHSGPIDDAPGEVWGTIDVALAVGRRGLPGGTTLARLLAKKRGHRNHLCLPSLTVGQILGWADAHFQRTGSWPNFRSGVIEDAAGESWYSVDHAFKVGSRGLRGGTSLHRFLVHHGRKARNH